MRNRGRNRPDNSRRDARNSTPTDRRRDLRFLSPLSYENYTPISVLNPRQTVAHETRVLPNVHAGLDAILDVDGRCCENLR